MVRSRISLDFRRERKKLLMKKPINGLVVKEKMENFRISLWNRQLALTEEDDLCFQAMNVNLAGIITERGIEVGGKMVIRDIGKLSQERTGMIKKRQGMDASNSKDRIEMAEVSKLIDK